MSKTKLLPTFSDPSLQKSVKELSPKIDSYHSGLDEISADIKALENHLQSNGVALNVNVSIRSYGQNRLYLEWAHWPITDKYRLLVAFYEEAEAKDEYGDSKWQFAEHKPLIECPASVRVDAIKWLPGLVDKIKEGIVELNTVKT